MQSCLHGPFLHLLLFSSVSFGLTAVVSKNYTQIKDGKTWTDAQNLCRRYYTDLATFYTLSDLSQLKMDQYIAWVGLTRRTSEGRNEWVWNDGHRFNFTDGNNTDYSRNCGAVDSDQRFYARNCENQNFFICQKSSSSRGILNPEYAFILEAKSWSQAQTYCTEKYDDLRVFQNDDTTKNNQQNFPLWIGLHKDGGSWNWSTGFSEFVKWDPGEPSNNGDCASITSLTKSMAANDCNNVYPFVCLSENVFLVKENKSWEEALERCRGLTSPTISNLHFHLLSLNPGPEQDYVMNKFKDADTEEVWTGLRFLAGEWLWVNGEAVLYADLPPCPTLGHHCGALSKKSTGSVKASDCAERKNFLCYSYY